MTITDPWREAAETRLQSELRSHPKAVNARYDRRVSRVVIGLENGLDLALPPRLAQGLERASPAELSVIEISPLGDGLRENRGRAREREEGRMADEGGGDVA